MSRAAAIARPGRALATLAALLALAAAPLAAQTIATVRVGPSVGTAAADINATFTVPVAVDFAAGATTRIASLSLKVTWDPQRLTLENVGAGTSGAVTSVIAPGEAKIVYFDAEGQAATFTAAVLRFRTTVTTSTTTVGVTVVAAGTETGQAVTTRVRGATPLAVCIGGASGGDLYGDVTGDRKVDVLDAQQVARFAVGLPVQDADRVRRLGDVTADDQVDVLDAQQIVRYDVGLPTTSRAGQPAGGGCVAATYRLVMLSPNPQSVAVNDTVVFRVRVTDRTGAPVAGITVTWDETGYQPFTQKTDADGEAATWRVPDVAGTVSGVVFIGQRREDAAGPVTYSYTATSGTPRPSGFRADVRYVGTVPPIVRDAFDRAIARLGRIVQGTPLAPRTVGTIALGGCTPAPETFSGEIRDVVIYAAITTIDGAGRTLAQAGPCIVDAATGMPLIGGLEIDAADWGQATQKSLENTILHELLHVLGFGTMERWDLLVRSAGQQNPVYTGLAGIAGWLSVGGTPFNATAVPIEAEGGDGTAGGHWRETILGTEMMTGYSGPGDLEPLSAVTVGALKDLGYLVNEAAAETYRVAGPGQVLGDPELAPRARLDVVRRPHAALTPDGRVVSMDAARAIRSVRAPRELRAVR